ncbi:MAG: TIGR01777 family protein [Candidatus Melainabacteria bacterium RIFCSPHIGHO2_02_FULL_34_12]|nr:MAG: TIGR01777 family protein [Candidatus Melainabacteria bacterium RIFCSPHIGHO2_02_FULL_34_12]
MKILITGGTGFIGKALRKELIFNNHELTILSRYKREGSEKLKFISWHWKHPKDLTEIIDGMDIVINLAGESVAGKKWTPEQKEKLRRSRIETTKAIVEAINKSTKKPKKLISASAVGIYGDRKDEKIIEDSILGSDFLASICKDWELEARKVETCRGTSLVILRFGIVLGANGGALEKILPPFKMFIGGPLGAGKQYMSWIALDDVAGIIKYAIDNDHISGIFNATAPNPVTNKEFSNVLGKILNRPSFMPVPAFALRFLMGEMADIVLTGQKVLPERVQAAGYEFKYEKLRDALKSILKESAAGSPSLSRTI